ncbi:helix-turn-helix domain-containing protein [Pseudoclavibacter helvolus]|uniref:helix-turn-helix domain-containing protein n=1 Tax=Pseudoclavibacter helvolus TaxID=255205 RepID=UPI003C76165F
MARPYLTVAQAARELQCAPSTVRSMLADGRLSGIDIGSAGRSRWRVRADALAGLGSTYWTYGDKQFDRAADGSVSYHYTYAVTQDVLDGIDLAS